MNIETPIFIDLLDAPGVPALSSSSDIPKIEVKPDSQNAAPADAPAEEQEQPAESATAATEEGADEEPSEQSGEPAKKSRGVQKALDRLASEREAEKQLRLAAEEREKQLLEALKAGKAPPVDPEPKADAESEPQWPNRTDFADEVSWQNAVQKYTGDRIDWAAKKAVEADRKAQAEEQARTQQEQSAQVAMKAHNERIDKAKEKYADYSDAVAQSQVTFTSPVIPQVLRHDESGADLAYYFAKNPDEAARIDALPIPSQLMELGVIKATKLAAEIPSLASAEVRPKPEISSAPPPIKPNRVSSAKAAKDPNEMSMEEYAAMRKAQQKAQGATRH